MSIDLNITRNFEPKASMLYGDSSESATDSQIPMTYTEWLNNVNVDLQPGQDMSKEYSKYLFNWKQKSKQRQAIQSRYVINKYKSALRNIAVNYTTDEQKRFLQNLDYNNPRHVESAITFFASKLKETSIFYADERQSIRNQKNLKSTTGTKQGLKQLINVTVPKLSRQQRVQKGGLKSPGAMTNNKVDSVVTTITELYDVEPVDPRDNTIEYDQQIFTDVDAAVRQLLMDCVPILELSSELGISLAASNGESDLTDITLLDYSNFYNYTKDQQNLNLTKLAEFIPSLVGNDIMFLSGGEVTPMVTAKAPWRNIFNRSAPAITNNKVKLYKSKYNLGSLNLPENIGILTYYGYNPTLVDTDTDYTGPIPDPSRYGPSVFAGSKHIPIEQNVDVTWFKADSSNDRLHGDITNVRTSPKFFGYRSDEEVKQTSKYGVSRWIDPVGFFSGEKNQEWANEDVFPSEAHNIFKVDERQKYLNVTDETPVEWSSDMFGNEYALMKRVSPIREPLASAIDDDEIEPNTECITIDGGDTLRPRMKQWADRTVNFEYYDGGRTGGQDPKVEQAPRMLPFPDIRRQKYYRKSDGTLFKALEPYNSFYDGPNPQRTELIPNTPITYHGFRPDPTFDTQSYGGLFTDDTCGVENPGSLQCDIQDNYVFGVFSDGLSGEGPDAMHISLPQTLEKIISGGDISSIGDRVSNSVTSNTFAQFTSAGYETHETSGPAKTSLLIYDRDTTDSIPATYKGNIPDVQGITKYIEVQTVNTGRDQNVSLKSTGIQTLREMVLDHNNTSDKKIDLSTLTGGGVRPEQDLQIDLTGSGYVIQPSGLSLTLTDNNQTPRTVTFIADHQLSVDQVTRIDASTYKYGVTSDSTTEPLARTLTNAITSASDNNDLSIDATHVYTDDYREVVLLAQQLPGSSGNVTYTGTTITDNQAYIQPVIATTSTTLDGDGVVIGVDTTYIPTSHEFHGGFESVLTKDISIGLMALTPGEIGNSIELTTDMITEGNVYSRYYDVIPASYSKYDGTYTTSNNSTTTLGLTATKPGGVTYTIYGNSLSSVEQLLHTHEYTSTGDLTMVPRDDVVIRVTGGVTLPAVGIRSTEIGPIDIQLIGDGVSTLRQLVADKNLIITTLGEDYVVASGHEIIITGGRWPVLSELVGQWNSDNNTNRVTVTKGSTTSITSDMKLRLSGGVVTVNYTVPQDYNNEAFDTYCNEHYPEFNPDVGFTSYGNDDPEGEIILRGTLDGETFASNCADVRGEFEYNVDNTVPLFQDTLQISETQYADEEGLDIFTPLTSYQENHASIGRGLFRSYNSARIASVVELIDPLIRDYSLFKNSDYDNFRNELANNKIRSMQMYCDVQMIETEKHIFFMKINFDPKTASMLPPGHPIILTKTTQDDNVIETTIRPYYDTDKHIVLFGHTDTHETGVIYPRLYYVDLNTMLFKQAFPTPGNDISKFVLTGDLIGYQYVSIDRPLICFNEFTNLHSVTYSCKLVNDDDITLHGVCTSDFEIDANGMTLENVFMYHTNPVKIYTPPIDEWEEEMLTLDFELEPNQYWIPTPQQAKHSRYRGVFQLVDGYDGTTVDLSATDAGPEMYTLVGNSLSSLDQLISDLPVELVFGDGSQIMGEWDTVEIAGGQHARGDQDVHVTQSISGTIGRLLSSFELNFNLSTKNIPTDGTDHRVNRLIFDPGDGGDIQVNDRIIASGLEALSFDINDLPDQSDLYDPRRFGFTHKYTFDNSSNTTTTATLTAVYNTFKKLIYSINIETDNFTIDSGFEDVKLIDTQTIVTENNKHKQMFVLETQNPRYISYVTVDRKNYTNSNAVGYVDGEIYAGSFHTMSDGTMMTGESHTPISREISLTPELTTPLQIDSTVTTGDTPETIRSY